MRDRFAISGTVTRIRNLSTFGNDVKNTQQSAPGNAYILETLEGVEFPRALNGKYLKRYYPSIWVDA